MQTLRRIDLWKFWLLLSLPLAGCRTASDIAPASVDPTMQDAAILALALPLYLTSEHTPKGPPVLASGDDAQIRLAAVADARADIAAGHPRVAYAGTIGVWPVGIPDEHLHLVKNLSEVPLPNGCTDSLALRAQVYAKAYNEVILQFLLKHPDTVSK